MVKSRTYNSIINSLYGIASSFLIIFINFFVRIILVKKLGAEINGLHNLFQSIATIMMLMELGISSAMVIHLYDPLKKENQALVSAIMTFYKRVYFIVAGLFTILSLIVSIFFLQSIVTTTVSINTVRFYFILFTFSFTINYLTYYKQSILFAEQKNRISIGITAFVQLVFRSVQIAFLLFGRGYLIFLLLMIFEKLAANLICNYYVNQYHPYLKKTNQEKLSREKEKAIFKTIVPLMITQIASTVQQSTKSIFISALLGNIRIVGYYGNYQLVISMIEMIFSQFGSAFTSSFGHLAVDSNYKKMGEVYKNSAFILNWIACICCAGFLACIQDFIFLLFGQNFVLDFISVAALTFNLSIYLLNIPIISIQNALGLHKLDAKAMIIQAILAIALAFVGGKYFGMAGIFLGLTVPLIIFTLIGKGILLSEKALMLDAKQYLRFIFFESFKIIACTGITAISTFSIPLSPSIISLVIKGSIALIVGLLVPVAFSYRSEQFKYVVNLVKTYIHRVKTRRQS
ncbi:lipopolysaccharide biosynthesis protein [Streptococcus intermedius]|uniref:lipopolysaccharide biosynthesis protein n=1 Tax=Streptococcus intermedius TaxID=1338 RepID=UPI00065FE2E9|nr:hypothetical protein [Streptococcus intermedius]